MAELFSRLFRRERHGEGLTELQRTVRQLSLEEAEARVLSLVSNAEHFEVQPATSEAAAGARLGEVHPVNRRLFERYARVRTRYSDLELVRSAVDTSSVDRHFIRLGTDTMDTEVVCRPGEVAVYGITEFDRPADRAEPPLASVYHYLLDVVAVIRPELLEGLTPGRSSAGETAT